MTKLPALVFDVNETLLDLESLTPTFERMFGDPAVMRQWFGQLILYSQALSLSGEYATFGALGAAVLKMVGEVHHKRITDEDIAAVKHAVVSMPPHPEVQEALQSLRTAGFRLFTLTNNPSITSAEQLERGGLTDLFERQFSIDDDVRRYKPARETYKKVEQELSLLPSQLCLIACHTWDTFGAVAVGWEAALILRPGNAPLGALHQPQIIGSDLTQVAEALIARYGSV